MTSFFHSIATILVSAVAVFTSAFHHASLPSNHTKESAESSTTEQAANFPLPHCNVDYSNAPCTPSPPTDEKANAENSEIQNAVSKQKSAHPDTDLQTAPKQNPPVNRDVQQTITPPTPPNLTLCNGTYYSHCPAGRDFVCPSDGGKAYCQASLEEQKSMADQNAQTIATLQAKIVTYLSNIQSDDTAIKDMNVKATTFLNQDNCSNLPSTIGEGNTALGAQAAAERCQADAMAANMEYKAEAPITEEINFYEQQITALRQEISDLSRSEN